MSRSSQAAASSAGNESAGAPRRELYAYKVRREGRVVAEIKALGAADGTVVVETEVHPVNRPPGEEGISRPFEFPDADYARRFVDEALLALEYLSCDVVE